MISKYKETHIKFTEEQFEIVKKKADELGLRPGTYVKKMAVQGEIKRYDLSELRDLTRNFKMIGVELNQIARTANIKGDVTASAMEEVLRQYGRLEKVMEKYLKPLKPNVVRIAHHKICCGTWFSAVAAAICY